MMAAIPYESPRLGITAVVSSTDFATLLDQRIARYQKMAAVRQIEAPPTNGEVIEPEPKAPSPNPLSRIYNKRLYRRI
jgi:hypothetical protein